MNIQRFTAPTTREALAKARLAFGEGTLILSTRPTANGVVVMATAEDALASLDLANSQGKPGKAAPPLQKKPSPAAMLAQNAKSGVEEDAALLAMSTLSFQDYVRERMLRRRHEAMNQRIESAALRLGNFSRIARASVGE